MQADADETRIMPRYRFYIPVPPIREVSGFRAASWPARLLRFVLLAVLSLAAPSAAQEDMREGRVVSTITVTGCRTRAEEILSRIALKAGKPWTQEAERQSRRDLHDMGVFKRVELNSRYDAASNGVAVDIKADDSWYFLPLPFIASSSDGRGFALTLVSGNIFRRAETLFARLKTGSGASAASAGFARGDWFISATWGRSSQAEKLYSDGAYSVAGTDAANSQAAPVADAYTRKSAYSAFSLARKFNDRHNIGLTFAQSKYSFADPAPSAPSEPGNHDLLTLSYSYALKSGGGASRSLGGLGVMFGMGLSDLEERLKPLSAAASTNEFGAKIARAGGFIGSDYDYTLVNLNWNGVWEFTRRDRLSFTVNAVKGWDLPFTQQVTSNGNGLLRGTYRRQWRGDKGFGATAAYSWFLRRTKRGVLVAEPFAEHSWVYSGVDCRTQAGAGMAFYYKFWRFPMPLGISFTRSFMDRDFAFAAAAGFGFGRQ